jgi:predicted RNase H-related nuclease YkuK (DUF458 family)
MFRKFNGAKIESPSSYIKKYLEFRPDIEIIIGTDSQVEAGVTTYATVIALYTPGRGAHCIYEKWEEDSAQEMNTRLINEVNASIACADALVKDGVRKPKYIDIDINPNPEYKSNKIFPAAKGIVEGMGYTVRYKKLGPLVTTIADYIVKH